ncbi:hypothetical protein MesoLjLc_46730 [Mesorhizobium sp. L-8-10]|nr:hypothetical protein MesoLjLc_46730 [Mesorhizobium sp. L-8-10]
MSRKDCVDVTRPDDPSSKTMPGIPRMFDNGRIAQVKPTSASGTFRSRINGYDLQEHIIAQAHEQIMGSHLWMVASERHVYTKQIADMLSACFQGGGNDCQVVELQWRLPFVRLASFRGMQGSSLSMPCPMARWIASSRASSARRR